MQRFCCFPLNETPNINVKMDCISTCCASDANTQEGVDDDVNDQSQKPIKREKKRSCCCKKRRTTSNSQANVDERR